MKVVVVRHGQTNYNVVGLYNVDPTVDVFLTKVGIGEAKQLAEQFKNEPFDAIFVSELPRTRQTAEYINQFHNLPILVDAARTVLHIAEKDLSRRKTSIIGRPTFLGISRKKTTKML